MIRTDFLGYWDDLYTYEVSTLGMCVVITRWLVNR